MRCSLRNRREHYEPSATGAWRMAAAGDVAKVVLIDVDYKAKG
jgi:hypothetical protein